MTTWLKYVKTGDLKVGDRVVTGMDKWVPVDETTPPEAFRSHNRESAKATGEFTRVREIVRVYRKNRAHKLQVTFDDTTETWFSPKYGAYVVCA